ncbi:Binding protein, putative isoform 1 [Theobroma cacao]|uniref:RING-type E3 ubiquitin transferase n=2 Tax=Theobroma cacao TaxID=3641 RepID=A0A061E1T0_THECC|nr:Binding protein, putative isoform 1 [Theobroma cacao]EOX98286.1 Binding protein, putative isoform 1 [Theobroma cacao]EOX98288.1 Binding protein, putative isoform 1 [Theobroma cacao]
MQGQGGPIDSFPETVNIDEGSSPNNASIGQPNSLHNMLNPVETRLSNHTVSAGGTMHGNAVTPDVQSFSGWSSGEPSSRLRLQNQVMQDVLNHHVNDDGTKMECGWSSSFGVCAGAAPRSEERRIEPPNVFFPGRLNGRSGNQVRSGPIYLQGSSSNHIPQSVNLNEGFISSSGNGGSVVGTGLGPNLHNSGGLEREQMSNACVSSDNVGSSSGSSNYFGEESNDGSGSSLGSWGLSCKRKALEGTSGQSYSAGTSSCFQQIENAAWHNGSARNDASSSLSLSTPSRNFLNVSPPDQSNPRVGLGMRGVVADAFPSSSVRRANLGNQQESLPFSLSSTGVAGHSSFGSSTQSRSSPFSDSLDLRPTAAIAGNSCSPPTQPHMRTISFVPRNVHPFAWNNTSNSRTGNPSSSINSGERAAALRDEPNIRHIPRNNAEHPMFVPAIEMRNVAQDPTGWSLASGNISTSGGVPSSSRPGPSSSVHPLPTPAWIPPHNPSIHNQQRLSEFAPWSLFPPIDSESGGHSGHFPPLSSVPSASSQETVVPSGSNGQGNNQPYPRSAFLLERQGDDVLGMPQSLRALAADIEGRHRLISEIRQVLNAMRRGENLRIEDYMLFDPFIYHGMAETHDRHRDMRLDVDNMSYEELLALEERIGDVSTGLSEETILKLMKQQKYSSTTTESPQELEPCCICQEEYADGDDTGTLDCGHDFHTNCIKQWLMLKNLCPICKTTALLK